MLLHHFLFLTNACSVSEVYSFRDSLHWLKFCCSSVWEDFFFVSRMVFIYDSLEIPEKALRFWECLIIRRSWIQYHTWNQIFWNFFLFQNSLISSSILLCLISFRRLQLTTIVLFNLLAIFVSEYEIIQRIFLCVGFGYHAL